MHTCLLVAGNDDLSKMLEPFADYDGEGNNPNWKFDSFEVGGRFADMLRLKTPRQTRRFLGLLPGPIILNLNTAKKSEIDQNALLANPPAALLFRGQWMSSPIVLGESLPENWRQEFAAVFAEIPDVTSLTIVDCHS
jgi:hypothetical protein